MKRLWPKISGDLSQSMIEQAIIAIVRDSDGHIIPVMLSRFTVSFGMENLPNIFDIIKKFRSDYGESPVFVCDKRLGDGHWMIENEEALVIVCPE